MKLFTGAVGALALLVVLMVGGAIPVAAGGEPSTGIPTMINYQGRLTDNTGSTLTDDVVIMFTLYDQPAGGSVQWQEPQPVSVDNGLFNVMLGSINPIYAAHLTGERDLGMQVVGYDEMAPRQRLVSVAYALWADQVNNANTLDGLDSEDFVAAAGDTMTGPLMIQDELTVDSNVGIGTANSTSKLTVSGGAGSVDLLLEADIGNSGEYDQPSLTLKQDGGTVQGQLGFYGGSNNLRLINQNGGLLLQAVGSGIEMLGYPIQIFGDLVQLALPMSPLGLLAETDGFIIGWVQSHHILSSNSITAGIGHIESPSPHFVWDNTARDSSSDGYASVLFVVRKGERWKVTTSSDYAEAYWIPLGR